MNSTTAARIAVSLGLAISAMSAGARAEEVKAEKLQRIPEIRTVIRACAADRSRLCADVAPGQGRIFRCLADRPDRLSPGCATAMANASTALASAGIAPKPGVVSK